MKGMGVKSSFAQLLTQANPLRMRHGSVLEPRWNEDCGLD
jgi:hypothetical protein